MKYSLASSSRAQMKIQQMAFVLVATMIFFSLVALFYFSIRITSLQKEAVNLREDEAKELVRKFSAAPEIAWTATDCASCIDLDKALLLKDKKTYQGFWNVPFIKITRIYPSSNTSKECTKLNYPDCDSITLVKENKNFISHDAFVSLCRYDSSQGGYNKCELGKIAIGFSTQ